MGRIANADPNAFQTGHLDSVTAAAIGGTSLFGAGAAGGVDRAMIPDAGTILAGRAAGAVQLAPERRHAGIEDGVPNPRGGAGHGHRRRSVPGPGTPPPLGGSGGCRGRWTCAACGPRLEPGWTRSAGPPCGTSASWWRPSPVDPGQGAAGLLISHNMPRGCEIVDRVHAHRPGRRTAVIRPNDCQMNEVVALMTGVLRLAEDGVLVDAKTEQPAGAGR